MVNNPYGISDKSYALLLEAIAAIPGIEKAVIFGSRAMGNYKKGSDIDLAVYGAAIKYDMITRLQTMLNQQLPIPYHVDVVHFETIESKELRDHITDFGMKIYPPPVR